MACQCQAKGAAREGPSKRNGATSVGKGEPGEEEEGSVEFPGLGVGLGEELRLRLQQETDEEAGGVGRCRNRGSLQVVG